MSKAENFIKENTRNDSNVVAYSGMIEGGNFRYHEWLTPDQARKATEIAREEMLNEVYEWIEENIGEYCDGENIMFSATDIENIDIFEQERFIKDLKQAMDDE